MLGREIEVVILMGLPWGVFVSGGLIILRSAGAVWRVVRQRGAGEGARATSDR